MDDVAHLHPLMQQTLRTGVIPSHAEIARATGRSADEVARALRETTEPESADDAELAAEPPDPDE